MRQIPLSVILSWPTPNYVDPPTQGISLVVINAVFMALVVITIGLRFYTRLYLKRWFGTDDIFIMIATLFTLGLNAAVILANVKYYWNRHIWDIPLTAFPPAGKIAISAKVLFICASFFTRCSLLSFYYRLTPDAGMKSYRWVLHSGSAFNVSFFLALFFLSIFGCRPISAYWTIGEGYKCIDEGSATLWGGIINCFADVLITTLPIPMIMKLQMPRRQRIGVVILLSLGFVVAIAGVLRTYFIWKSLINTYDETWYAYPLWICAAVEIDLAVLCACAPALRPLLMAYAQPLMKSMNSLYTSKASRNRSIGTQSGALSSSNGRPSEATNRTLTNFDYQYEKGFGPTDEEESVEFGGKAVHPPERKIARPSPAEKMWKVQKTQSFDVTYEKKPMSHERRGSEDKRRGSVVRPGRKHNEKPSRPHTHQGYTTEPVWSFTNDPRISEAFGPTNVPRLAPVLLSPRALSSLPALGQIEPNESPAHGPEADTGGSFFISQPSADGEGDESLEHGGPANAKANWPLPGSGTLPSRGELRNGERRWDIDRNPFQDPDFRPRDQYSIAVPPRSAGSLMPGHSRWKSDPSNVWAEIHQQKQEKGLQRSGSLGHQPKGIARML